MRQLSAFLCFSFVLRVLGLGSDPFDSHTSENVANAACGAGIGKETARVLAMRGATVIVACRDENRGQGAVDDILRTTGVGSDKVIYMSLDLGSFESIRAFASAYLAKNWPIHFLILNAGVMIPDWGVTREGFENTFGINHVGHFLLTSLLIEKVKASQPSRIVALSSAAHTMGDRSVLKVIRAEKDYSKYKSYGNSKLANLLFARELNRRLLLENANVSVNAVHPGVISTELGRDSTLAKIFYTMATPFSKSIPQGAATTCFVATHPSVTPQNSGKYYADSAISDSSEISKNDQLALDLWTLSEELIGAKFLPLADAAAPASSASSSAASSAPQAPQASL